MIKKVGIPVVFSISIILLFYFNYYLPQKVKTIELENTSYSEKINKKPVFIAKKNNKKITEQNGWQLIFYDEFDRQGLNSNWTILQQERNSNNELQAYRKENVEISDGRLNLVGKEEVYKNSSYTSGLVQTKGKLNILYGKIEVKGNFPAGKGLFPAVWLLRSDERDSLPELDLLEAIGQEPETVYMVHHWKENGQLKTNYEKTLINNFNEDHVYSIEWEPREVRWYIDGRLLFSSANNVPNVPMYLIINLAIGGNWPGNPDQSTVFPAKFSIDYVKIYRKAGD